MSDYQKELDYQLSILRATALRPKGEALARGLFDYRYSNSLSAADRAGMVESLVALASEIQNDERELDAFRWQFCYLKYSAQREPVSGVPDFLEARCRWLAPYLLIQYNELTAKVAEITSRRASATL